MFEDGDKVVLTTTLFGSDWALLTGSRGVIDTYSDGVRGAWFNDGFYVGGVAADGQGYDLLAVVEHVNTLPLDVLIDGEEMRRQDIERHEVAVELASITHDTISAALRRDDLDDGDEGVLHLFPHSDTIDAFMYSYRVVRHRKEARNRLLMRAQMDRFARLEGTFEAERDEDRLIAFYESYFATDVDKMML
jgi:hypothetical protein